MSTPELTLALARQLIQIDSITPNDNGCQEVIAVELQKIGFACETMSHGDVTNLWARHGTEDPLFVFAGHTDVVPIGPIEQWTFEPFSGTISDGFLHGRGAADMKGSIAAMITATQRFVDRPYHGSIGFLITSDEDGPAVHGTQHVLAKLQDRAENIKWCIVGEPTSYNKVGDIIKNGRRGSLNAVLTIYGIQGHVAYPDEVANPIHIAAPLIANLTNHEWDNGNEDFPPTTFQISNIRAGTGASNVVPGEIEIMLNFRFSPESTVEELKEKMNEICNRYSTRFEIEWQAPSSVYYTSKRHLVDIASKAVTKRTGRIPDLTTDGGTSDGRFIAKTGTEVIELGPVNNTIHKVNERVRIKDLITLSEIYEDILKSVFS